MLLLDKRDAKVDVVLSRAKHQIAGDSRAVDAAANN
jgi:hypothetical protein